MAAANNADIIPIIKIFSFPEYKSGSTIPFRIVEVTSPPAKYAPRNSNIAAINIACVNVIALLPTDVPIALATSFAPMPNAIKKPAKAAINNITVGPASTIIGSFILNTILVELAGKVKNIKPFPFYISSNMPNANSNNNILIKKYKRLNKHL